MRLSCCFVTPGALYIEETKEGQNVYLVLNGLTECIVKKRGSEHFPPSFWLTCWRLVLFHQISFPIPHTMKSTAYTDFFSSYILFLYDSNFAQLSFFFMYVEGNGKVVAAAATTTSDHRRACELFTFPSCLQASQ